MDSFLRVAAYSNTDSTVKMFEFFFLEGGGRGEKGMCKGIYDLFNCNMKTYFQLIDIPWLWEISVTYKK